MRKLTRIQLRNQSLQNALTLSLGRRGAVEEKGRVRLTENIANREQVVRHIHKHIGVLDLGVDGHETETRHGASIESRESFRATIGPSHNRITRLHTQLVKAIRQHANIVLPKGEHENPKLPKHQLTIIVL